jgi:hypothetical protein
MVREAFLEEATKAGVKVISLFYFAYHEWKLQWWFSSVHSTNFFRLAEC